ncbi:MAG: nicotinate-nucleotide adenylyltransferase [Acetobacteraceae bacterium]|nr:nicotinate-nucleotide adenylyltransferase [Acetobacteraceae bacterium]
MTPARVGPDPLPRFGDRRRTRVGILGGSFNPAHAGHLHVARLARNRLQLDQVWLLVSPGNVLKPEAGMAPFGQRLAWARGISDGRRIVATGIEEALRTRLSVDTIKELQRRFPRVTFVWVMGADILAQLPQWHRWTEFAARVPLLVVPRRSFTYHALAGKAAQRLRATRLALRTAAKLASARAPAWLVLMAPQNPLSASALRAARKGGVS